MYKLAAYLFGSFHYRPADWKGTIEDNLENGEVALFVDLENITTALWKNFQQGPDPFAWVAKVRKYGPMSFARAYGDMSQPHLARLESELRAAGIETFNCPVKQRGDRTQSTVDANIIIDLYEVAMDRPGIRTFVLMAGDSDYVRVVARLRNRLTRDVVIAGVPGSVSRDLIRAGTSEDPVEPTEAPVQQDDSEVIRLIARFEDSLHSGYVPTFNGILKYVMHPNNTDIIHPSLVQAKLGDLVERGVLEQFQDETGGGRPIRITQLDRYHSEVEAALGIATVPRREPTAAAVVTSDGYDDEYEDDYDDPDREYDG